MLVSEYRISNSVIDHFFYNFIKPLYGCHISLFYTDTDSLLLDILADIINDDIKPTSAWFDTSNYDPDHIYGIIKSPPVIGKLEDEYIEKAPHSSYRLKEPAKSEKKEERVFQKMY